jgi:hypothetical protein
MAPENTVIELVATSSVSGSVIRATDRDLKAVSQTNFGGYPTAFPNFFAPDVKFVFIDHVGKYDEDDKNFEDIDITVLEGVQDVLDIPVGSYAVIEKRGNNNVITTVFIPKAPEGALGDIEQLIFIPSLARIGTIDLDGSTRDIFRAFRNGVEIEGGIAVEGAWGTATDDNGNHASGFFRSTVREVNGRNLYRLTAFNGTSPGATNLRVARNATLTSLIFMNDNLAYINATTTAGTGLTTLTNAALRTSTTIVDTRTSNDPAITPTIRGLNTAVNGVAHTLYVSAIVDYRDEANNAMIVYITRVVAP